MNTPPILSAHKVLEQMTLKKISKREQKLKQLEAKYGADHPRCEFIRLQLIKLRTKVSNLTSYKL